MEISWQSNSPNVMFPQVLEPHSENYRKLLLNKPQLCSEDDSQGHEVTWHPRNAHPHAANGSGVVGWGAERGSRGHTALTDTPSPPHGWLPVSSRWGTTGRPNQRAPTRQRSPREPTSRAPSRTLWELRVDSREPTLASFNGPIHPDLSRDANSGQ